MATATTSEQKEQGETRTQGGESEGVGSPISNEAYNVISAHSSKCERLEANRKYARDSDDHL